MNASLADLGKNPAVRRLTLLVPSGLLFLGAAAAGLSLGHVQWYTLQQLVVQVNAFAGLPVARSIGAVVLAATAVALLAAGVALVVHTLAGAVEALWTGDWPAPLGPLARRLICLRQRRWERADRAYAQALRHRAQTSARAAIGAVATSDAQLPDTAGPLADRDRICLVRPGRPTWIGDRIRATHLRVHITYHLDLDSVWPRLWLIAPDAAREELRTARGAYDAATCVTAWSIPYLLLGVAWWPAALIGLACASIGRHRGRAAMGTFAGLVESAVDLYARELAETLGRDL